MAKFWRFVWAFIKKWWALMSCAAFTALGLISALATNGSKWTIAGTVGMAGVFGVFGAFQLWNEQHGRADKAEQELQKHLASPPVTSKEWQELADKMSTACQGFRADFQVDTKGGFEAWEIKGAPHGGICEALVKQAGVMLLRSPRVNAGLTDAIRAEPRPQRSDG